MLLDAIKEMESEQTGRILANAMNMDSLRQVPTLSLFHICDIIQRCCTTLMNLTLLPTRIIMNFPEHSVGYHSINTTIQHESHAYIESIDLIQFATYTTI